ncbi:MAG TPA: WecB/TagA/CpsF family glycosyltransferase [Terriglobales bacterium]|nr:WecB/TagA/CpsF family glycosyltransferase [Terriglobales bacterium]
MPVDVIDMAGALKRIDEAVTVRNAFQISTPNLNFLTNSLDDPEFRETLLDSDLCPADGMPIVWIGRLIGAPIEQRVSGSDIFDALKLNDPGRPLTVCLFGGEDGVAEEAARTLNATPCGLKCVGAISPGFGSIEEMSRDETIDRVNATKAEFLAASLGAKKGQLWLHRNHQRLTIPVRAHLGATINFQIGRVRRAPNWLRPLGFEWLWRIKEEPHLWHRYARDGAAMARLIVTRALPLAILNRWHDLKYKWNWRELAVNTDQNHDSVTIRLSGDASRRNLAVALKCFRETLTNRNSQVVIDLTDTRVIDARFLGLLLMVRKKLKGQGAKLKFIGLSPAMRRLFRLNEVDFLLASADKP